LLCYLSVLPKEENCAALHTLSFSMLVSVAFTVVKITRSYIYCDVFCLWRRQMWRARVLETPFGLLLCFIYDFTSRHYNFFYNVRSSLPCWFFILVGPLTAGFLVAALILGFWSALVPLLWHGVSDRLVWSARFYCSPPWDRVLAPRIEDILSKGNFSSVGQVVLTGITSVNIRCYDNNCLPIRCLGIATILSLIVVAGKR
jgi:hypothetical protein